MTKKTVIIIAFIFSALLLVGNVYAQNKSRFTLGEEEFLLDNKPFQMISGEMHYTRVPVNYWRDRMRMAKAMGLNTIGTYVFWNTHEPMPEKYDFSGNNDIYSFIKTAQEEGLWVVLRPSPYACAEWEFGGYPWWLLKDSMLKVRSKDPHFIAAYTRYMRQLAKQITPLLVTNGGNILMIQIENEYGSYSDDKSYMELNRKIFREVGLNGILFTCDGADQMPKGYLPGFLPAVNGLEDPAEVKALINKYHGGKGPYYIAEWYPGWFDQWGKPHANVPSANTAAKLDKILAAGISINMYMFHGGTTRGFMNGANRSVNDPYAPQVSSYDYDAPLDEAGNPTEKFFAFRKVISKYLPEDQALPPVPERRKTIAVEKMPFTQYAALFSNLPRPVLSRKPLCFEDINQAYGFVLYRTHIARPGRLKINGLRDYAVVYLNGRQIGTLDRRLDQDSIQLARVPAGATLDILIENNGRINYGPFLTDNRKGIIQDVTLDGTEVFNWEIYGLPFNDLHALKFNTDLPDHTTGQPVFYKGYFELKKVGDTYLDMSEFGKGFVFLNGYNLGKYWQIGPQQSVYVPSCWLKKGKNEIVVFDELKQGHTFLRSSEGPQLNKLSLK